MARRKRVSVSAPERVSEPTALGKESPIERAARLLGMELSDIDSYERIGSDAVVKPVGGGTVRRVRVL